MEKIMVAEGLEDLPFWDEEPVFTSSMKYQQLFLVFNP